MPTDKLKSHFSQNRATGLKRGDSQGVKSPPANAGDVSDVGSTPRGWEDPLEEEMATCSSILAWRIPWTDWWATVIGVAKSRTRRGMHAINIILMPKERGSREQRSTLERDVCSNLQGHGGHSPGQAVGNKQTSRPGGQYPRHQHREAGSS